MGPLAAARGPDYHQDAAADHGQSDPADTSGAGRAGDLTVQAGRLLLTNSAAIRARSLNLEAGAGAGGNISVQVGRLELTGGSQIDSSTRAAKGGALTVTAAEEIAISGGSSGLVSGTYGSGAGLADHRHAAADHG